MNRRLLRNELLNLLYKYEIYDRDLSLLYLEDLDKEITDFFTDIIINLERLDDLISNNLFDYTFDRLALVDKAILRIATYELTNTDTAASIIINEAIELTKRYSDLDDEKQHKFNNKVLDSIKREVRNDEPNA